MSGAEQPTLPSWRIPIILGLIVYVADQWTKAWAVATLGPEPFQRTLIVVDDWLRLIYTRNDGVAFGLFQGMPILFTTTSILITIGAIYAYGRYLPHQVRLVQIAMGLVLGGAFGNITDRLRLSYVVDFISVGWWPVFNVADSAITTGVTLLAAYLIFVGDEPQPAPRPMPRDDGLLRELLSRDVD
ncbi:MAG: signal peptidase II [Oscillochloridaceae bacterium umkhey_bin13]